MKNIIKKWLGIDAMEKKIDYLYTAREKDLKQKIEQQEQELITLKIKNAPPSFIKNPHL